MVIANLRVRLTADKEVKSRVFTGLNFLTVPRIGELVHVPYEEYNAHFWEVRIDEVTHSPSRPSDETETFLQEPNVWIDGSIVGIY